MQMQGCTYLPKAAPGSDNSLCACLHWGLSPDAGSRIIPASMSMLHQRGTVALYCQVTPCCAGTGKSLVLKHIIRALPAGSTFVTAPTAQAASALGGTTIHAFAGVGRADGDAQALVKAASRPDALKRWRAAAVLIVDEVGHFWKPQRPALISMLSACVSRMVPDHSGQTLSSACGQLLCVS